MLSFHGLFCEKKVTLMSSNGAAFFIHVLIFLIKMVIKTKLLLYAQIAIMVYI